MGSPTEEGAAAETAVIAEPTALGDAVSVPLAGDTRIDYPAIRLAEAYALCRRLGGYSG